MSGYGAPTSATCPIGGDLHPGARQVHSRMTEPAMPRSLNHQSCTWTPLIAPPPLRRTTSTVVPAPAPGPGTQDSGTALGSSDRRSDQAAALRLRWRTAGYSIPHTRSSPRARSWLLRAVHDRQRKGHQCALAGMVAVLNLQGVHLAP